MSRRRVRALLGAGYLGLCAGLAAAALFPDSSGPWWYWSLVLVTMPVGTFVAVLHYFAAAFVLPALDGWVESSLLFLVWMGAAAAQLMAVLIATKNDERPPRG